MYHSKVTGNRKRIQTNDVQHLMLFLRKLKEYQHTTAKTYDMHLQTEKTTSDVRGYDTIFDSLFFNQEVDQIHV